MPLQDSDLFLVTKADGSESRHIRADNLFSGIADDWVVLVDENGISKRCVVGDLRYKASDDRYMLVNVVDKSYKVKSSTVVSQYAGPPPPVSITSTFTYDKSVNYSGVAATFDETFSSIQPTILQPVKPTNARTVEFDVPMNIPAGSTLIATIGARTEADSSSVYSLSDSKSNSYTSVIQGTQSNGLSFATIFMANIDTPLTTSDTLTWECPSDMNTTFWCYGCLYVIDSQGVSVIDTDDLQTSDPTYYQILNIDAQALTVAFTATGSNKPPTATNPDFTYLEVKTVTQNSNSGFGWYLVGTELGNGSNPTP